MSNSTLSKNFSKGYTDIQAKVRTATSNDPWGPSGTQMNELARATFGQYVHVVKLHCWISVFFVFLTVAHPMHVILAPDNLQARVSWNYGDLGQAHEWQGQELATCVQGTVAEMWRTDKIVSLAKPYMKSHACSSCFVIYRPWQCWTTCFMSVRIILFRVLKVDGLHNPHLLFSVSLTYFLNPIMIIGSENVVKYARDNLYIVKTLKEFQFIDEDGKDQGSNGMR